MPLVVKSMIVSILFVLVFVVVVRWRAASREANVEAQFPATGQFVEVDGTKIHLKVIGQGPDLVLIHGANGSLRDFTFSLVDRLKADFRVIALDRPGLGWSERPSGYGSVFNVVAEPPALQARILQAASDKIGVKNPIVIGHSYGGTIALAWALERPNQTAGLVLLGAATNPWEGELGWLYRVNSSLFGSLITIPLITALTPRGTIAKALGEIFTPQASPDGYLDHISAHMTLRRSTQRANAQQVNTLKPYIIQMHTRYSSLTLPVEILHGTQDIIVPLEVHAKPLSQQIPDAVLTRLEGVGHMPHHADPEATLSAIHRVAARAGLR
ncbi:MAG: alpha/beta hydrolase [Paracoccaceae bacterium]